MASSAKVSTFELLVKPIADPSITFIRKVINGYFLIFTNVGPDAVVRFMSVIPKFTPGPGIVDTYADRELTVSGAVPGPPAPVDPSGVTNHNAIFDVTGGPAGPPTFGQTDFGELRYVGETDCIRVFVSKDYEICNGATAGFRLLPNLGPGPDLIPRERFEVRGFLSIGLVRFSPDISFEPAGGEYLLAPEQRGTFLPLDVDSASDPVDLDELTQIDTALPTAEGPRVTLTPNSQLSKPVDQWAEAEGFDKELVVPFDNILTKIVP